MRPNGLAAPVIEFEAVLHGPPEEACQTLAQALASGSLLGAGLLLGDCGPDHLTFVGSTGLRGCVPDRGELRWVPAPVGSGLRLSCRLWCGAQRRRVLLRAIVVAAGAWAFVTLAWSWLPLLAMPLALLLAAVLDSLGWRTLRRRWAARVQAGLHNIEWLRASSGSERVAQGTTSSGSDRLPSVLR
ncbi:MAG: hypothetical protein IPG96_01530 [Proteobacteria bacterium]|nr:hypothetical protein [Pseudomonadota bacterium]